MSCADPSRLPLPVSGVSRTLEAELSGVVARAQLFTAATAAAICLRDEEGVVCRANTGAGAPEVGTRVDTERSLTALALSTGKVQRCDDAELDPREEAAKCGQAGIRSTCMVPITDHGTAIGVLAVFSTNVKAFSDYHVALLKTMADAIRQSVEREHKRDQRQDAPAPAAPVESARVMPASVSAPPRVPTPPPKAAVPRPEKVVTLPFPRSEPAAAAAVARAQEKSVAAIPASAARVAPPAVAVPSFGDDRRSMFAAAKEEPERGGRRMMVVAAAAAAVLVVVLLVFAGVSRSSSKTVSASAPAVTPSAPAVVPEASAAPVAEQPATVPAPPTTQKPEPPKPVRETASLEKRAPQENVLPAKPAADTPRPVMVAGGAVPHSAAPVTDVAAPSLVPATSPALPALGAAAPAVPSLTVVTVPPRLVSRVEPVYPEIAKRIRVHGAVVLAVSVDARGSVSNVRPVSGNSMLFNAAIDAIRRWKYSPQTANGKPVASVVQVVVNFEMPRQ